VGVHSGIVPQGTVSVRRTGRGVPTMPRGSRIPVGDRTADALHTSQDGCHWGLAQAGPFLLEKYLEKRISSYF